MKMLSQQGHIIPLHFVLHLHSAKRNVAAHYEYYDHVHIDLLKGRCVVARYFLLAELFNCLAWPRLAAA